VFRDPRDVFFSQNNHRDNLMDRTLAETIYQKGANAFHDWLHEARVPGAWDRKSLDALLQFFRTYWNHRDLDNVHLFHYSDMKRNLAATIALMAKAAGLVLDARQVEAYAGAASFDSMKARAGQFVPESGKGFWKAEGNFFANGANEQWKGRLTDAELVAFDARLAELATPEQAAWLLNGRG